MFTHSSGASNAFSSAYSAQGTNKSRDLRQVQCYLCKQFGHIARNCSKKYCNYCKQRGHIITKCPSGPAQCLMHAFHATVGSAGSTSQPTRLVGSHILTLEKVQQIVLSALSTLGIQGKPTGTSTTWLVDSGASNHMTGSLDHLYNAHAYDGTQNIHIVHGNTTSIFVVRDINSIL